MDDLGPHNFNQTDSPESKSEEIQTQPLFLTHHSSINDINIFDHPYQPLSSFTSFPPSPQYEEMIEMNEIKEEETITILGDDHPLVSHEYDPYNCYCPICEQGFIDEYSLIDHHLLAHDSGLFSPYFALTDDDVPSYSYGEHSCPICQQRYLTNIQLNEHFALAHDNYEELCEMDQKKSAGRISRF